MSQQAGINKSKIWFCGGCVQQPLRVSIHHQPFLTPTLHSLPTSFHTMGECHILNNIISLFYNIILLTFQIRGSLKHNNVFFFLISYACSLFQLPVSLLSSQFYSRTHQWSAPGSPAPSTTSPAPQRVSEAISLLVNVWILQDSVRPATMRCPSWLSTCSWPRS